LIPHPWTKDPEGSERSYAWASAGTSIISARVSLLPARVVPRYRFSSHRRTLHSLIHPALPKPAPQLWRTRLHRKSAQRKRDSLQICAGYLILEAPQLRNLRLSPICHPRPRALAFPLSPAPSNSLSTSSRAEHC
jgi:hypothetical protein